MFLPKLKIKSKAQLVCVLPVFFLSIILIIPTVHLFFLRQSDIYHRGYIALARIGALQSQNILMGKKSQLPGFQGVTEGIYQDSNRRYDANFTSTIHPEWRSAIKITDKTYSTPYSYQFILSKRIIEQQDSFLKYPNIEMVAVIDRNGFAPWVGCCKSIVNNYDDGTSSGIYLRKAISNRFFNSFSCPSDLPSIIKKNNIWFASAPIRYSNGEIWGSYVIAYHNIGLVRDRFIYWFALFCCFIVIASILSFNISRFIR